MREFERKFITEWRRLDIVKNRGVVLAVSGGADSCALLAAFAGLRDRSKILCDCTVAHFDHGLRGEHSTADLEFCKELAERFRLPFVSGVVENPLHGNLEQAAREARYEFLTRTAVETGSGAILTGHTIDDQAETFLQNLLRGSGPDGLAGMVPVRYFDQHPDIKLIRPMLRWATRSDTEEFCGDKGVDFRSDSMNEDISFNRVRIRKELLPFLAEFNPNVVETLARTSETLLELRLVIEFLIGQNEAIDGMVKSERLRVSALRELPAQVRITLVREWIRNQRKTLRGVSSAHLNGIVALALSTKSGKEAELPGGLRIIKANGHLQLK